MSRRDDGFVLLLAAVALWAMRAKSPEGKITILDVKQTPKESSPPATIVKPQVSKLDET